MEDRIQYYWTVVLNDILSKNGVAVNDSALDRIAERVNTAAEALFQAKKNTETLMAFVEAHLKNKVIINRDRTHRRRATKTCL